MKKLTNGILWAIGLVGAYLVSEGIITGEELSDMQNVIGMALGGGALSIGMVIAIIKAIPTQLVNLGYNKAVEKYGAENVEGFLGKIDDLIQLQEDNKALLNEVNQKLDEAKAVRQSLLNE